MLSDPSFHPHHVGKKKGTGYFFAAFSFPLPTYPLLPLKTELCNNKSKTKTKL
jgi:hypothetical protein